MAFTKSITQAMPGYGSGSNYGYGIAPLTATGSLTVAAATTTPATGGQPFNLNGGPPPSRGLLRLRSSSTNVATTQAVAVTATDGTTTLNIAAVSVTTAGQDFERTFEINTDLGITSITATNTLGGGTTVTTLEMEFSLNP